MKDKVLLIAFLAASLWAGWWAFYLIGVHWDAVYEVEGAACGPEGGCSAVLQSSDAEIFGIPVSVPAVPMLLFLAVLGGLVLADRFDRARLATLGTLCAGVGLLYGGWLLFKMVYYIDSICQFCLVMDGSNLAVLVLALFLHPDGPKGALKSIAGLPAHLKGMTPELLLAPVVLVGMFAVQAATVREAPPEESVVVETTPAPTVTPASSATPARPTATPRRPTGAPPPGTRRLVLPDEVVDLAIDSSVPFKGPAGAEVTIVLFEDFQCPYCKKLTGNIETLLDDPAYASRVRVGFMHFPMHSSCNDTGLNKDMHKFACGAAMASVCAEQQGRFWEMHDVLFRNNGRLRGSHIRSYAREIGLDMDAWNACLQDPATKEKIMADARVGKAGGVRGTPALFIGGRRLVGAQPVESLKAAIDVVVEGTEGRVLLDVELEGETIGDLEGAAPTVTLQGPDGPFTIDAFEASIDRGAAVSRAGVPPARSVTWYDARDACEAAGKRLCTEQEWMIACTGAEQIDEDKDGILSRDLLQGRQHAYGEHYREGWCADSRKSDDLRELLTGNHPRCATPEGVYDLEGVTKEWIGLSPDQAVTKGGSYKSGASARCGYYKDSDAPDAREDTIGFRCCSGGDPDADATADEYPGGKVGDTVQDFSGERPDGGVYGTEQLRGSPFIMTFWATWCEPCKKELPALAEAYDKHQGEGLKVIAINVDSDASKVAPFLERTPLPFPVIFDTDKSIMDAFQSRSGGVPLTFWVERDGTIRQRTTGYDDSAHAQFMRNVEALLER